MNNGTLYRYIGDDLSMGLRRGQLYDITIVIWPKRYGGNALTVDMQDFFGNIVWRCPYRTLAEFRKNWRLP